jgi:hypothetical protein
VDWAFDWRSCGARPAAKPLTLVTILCFFTRWC